MIDLKQLRQAKERFRKGAADKGDDMSLVDQLVDHDERLRSAITEREQLTAEKNKISKQIGQLAGQLKKAMSPQAEQLQGRMKQLQQRPNQIKERDRQLNKTIAQLEAMRNEVWLRVPQPADSDVPVGGSADDNVEIRRWNPGNFDTSKSFEENKGFAPKSHVDLGLALGMIDFRRGVNMAGSRSYVLTGHGMRLHQAILRYAFDFMVNEIGFQPVSVPVLVREQLMVGTGFFPKDKESAYRIANPTTDDEFYLTGTGEAGLMGLHANEILDADQLPLCYTTVSTCFRREAGAAGKDTAGLFRIHQFEKVEQVVICIADEAESRQWHQRMIGYVETMLQRLQLPYRLLQCCTADLGPKNADMIDVECWMPGRGDTASNGNPKGSYAETHSASRLYDYQCRRLNLRYREKDSKSTVICHALNNTVVASPRILIPIMEMYQEEDGTIVVPEVLRSYLGGLDRIV